MRITITTRAEALRNAAMFIRELDFTPPLPPEGKTKRQRFLSFHEKNPQVYKNIKSIIFQKILDHKRPSTKGAVEDLREDYADATVSDEYPNGKRYKYDNSFTAFYNHMLIEEHPELAAYLEQRKQYAEA